MNTSLVGAFFETSSLGFGLVGRKLELLQANLAFKAWLERQPDSPSAGGDILKHGAIAAACLAAMKDGKTTTSVMIDLNSEAGAAVALRAEIFPVPQEKEIVAGIVLKEVITAGTQGASDSEKQARLNRELMREMDAFAYSISHDLKAPLRAVTGFSQALSMEVGAMLQGRPAEYLHRVQGSAERMSQMMDRLLGYSRAARQEPVLSKVDVSLLAGAVSRQLQEKAGDRTVEWIIQPNLVAITDEKYFRAVLEILFDNALKFTVHQAKPRVEFGVRQAGGVKQFYVRDNGAGYDPGYAEKLFSPFQRLHSPDDFPGEGMGLAIARRIVRRLGGQIGGESQPEQGATFFFTLE